MFDMIFGLSEYVTMSREVLDPGIRFNITIRPTASSVQASCIFLITCFWGEKRVDLLVVTDTFWSETAEAKILVTVTFTTGMPTHC